MQLYVSGLARQRMHEHSNTMYNNTRTANALARRRYEFDQLKVFVTLLIPILLVAFSWSALVDPGNLLLALSSFVFAGSRIGT